MIEKESNAKWIFLAIGAPVIVAIFLVFFNPFGYRWAYQLKAKVITPDVEVKIRNVLITRRLEDEVFELSVSLQIVNREDADCSIRLLALKNVHTGESVSLVDMNPISVRTAEYVDSDFLKVTSTFGILFQSVPLKERSNWSISYKVAPFDKELTIIAQNTEIECLHYYLLPLKLMQEVRNDTSFQVIWNIEEAIDTSGRDDKVVGWDTVGFYFYPKNRVWVRMDQNLDKIPDNIVRADSLKYHVHNFSEGKFLDVIVDYEGLKESVSGIIIGMVEINKLLSHSYFRMKLFNPDTEKKLVQVLEECADKRIPLSYAEFIYWKFNSE
ncbi:MAG TPA: hypothetical protein VHP63_05400 [candidate division Zixibacteria bacterium]|nr:hypothetical protein [candidate division Zixibacteria bacterium]